MVHSSEDSNQAAWMMRLGPVKGLAAKAARPFKDAWDALDQLRLGQCQGFDFADVMEQGRGPGLVSSFVDPPQESGSKGEQRLQVVFDRKRGICTLTTEAGEKLLEAHSRKDVNGFDIFVARGKDNSKLQDPLFLLRGDTPKEKWTLRGTRCPRCELQGKLQCGNCDLARFLHYQEPSGDGHAFCMDLELPAHGEDGSPAVVCEVCSESSEKLGHTMLTTRRPKWNPRHKTLTLDFRGRVSMASAKNFQLEVLGQPEPGQSRLLFGKIAVDKYVLDFQRPLGTVHAFAAALSSLHWR